MIVPSEARATMTAYRDGRSLEQFLKEMWERRESATPREAKSQGGWPYGKAEPIKVDATVTRIGKKGA